MKTPALYLNGRKIADVEVVEIGPGEYALRSTVCCPEMEIRSVDPFELYTPDGSGWSDRELYVLACHKYGARPHRKIKIMVRRMKRIFRRIAQDERHFRDSQAPLRIAAHNRMVDEERVDVFAGLSSYNTARAAGLDAPAESGAT